MLRILLALSLLTPSLGCATFTYERTGGQPPPGGPRTSFRLGVARFAQPAAAGFYPIWFSNTLNDPIGDLSRAVAEELRRSGRFADVVYLGAPTLDAADLDYYRTIYRLDAILAGEVTRFQVSAVAELWSLVPPFIVLWPLHFIGLPAAPSRDSVVLHATLGLRGLAPGAGGWRSTEQRLSWRERNWYAVQRIPAIERAVQTHAMDHFVAALAGLLLCELTPDRLDSLLPGRAAAATGR